MVGLGCGPAPGSDVVTASEHAIFGGAVETGYPAVGVLQFTFPNGKSFCTGTLIRPNIVISAAHCFLEDNKQLSPFTRVDFALGAINNTSEVVRVDAYVLHPNYMSLDATSDVSLLRLERSITSVSPAVLSNIREVP